MVWQSVSFGMKCRSHVREVGPQKGDMRELGMAGKKTIIAINSSLRFGMAVVQGNAQLIPRAEACVTREVLHMDGGAHPGQW